MKRGLVIASIVSLVLAGWLIRRAYLVHAQSVRAAQARDAGYQVVLKQYQQDLPIGTTGAEVKSYLESHHVEHTEMSWGEGPSYVMPIAEEPGDGIACSKWTVYVALTFTGPSGDYDPLSSSTLKEIKIHKWGTCV